jgi:DNA repair protein RecO (recombination protein O)
LLSHGLSVLDDGPAHPDVVTAFLLHLATVVGLAPSLDVCAGCGRDTGLDRFSFSAGGVVCETCRPDGAVRLRAGLTAYLAELAGTDFSMLAPADPMFSGEAMGVVRRFMEFHLERRFASLAILTT